MKWQPGRELERPGAQKTQLIRNTNTSPPAPPPPQPLVVRRLKRPGETGEAARQYGRARIWLWSGVLRFETSSTRIAASP